MDKLTFEHKIENCISDWLRKKKLPYLLKKETVYFINSEEEQLYLCRKLCRDTDGARGRGISVNELYLKYRRKMSIELIVNKFIIDAENPITDGEGDIDSYRERIGAVLISKSKNAGYLRKKPHRNILDLALTYQIMFKNGDKIDCTPVTYELMKRYGLSEGELYENAISYIREMFRPKMEREGRAIRISNELGILGAAAILDGELMNRVAEECKGDFAIIPTSLHELHAFPLKEINAEKIGGVLMGLREISEPEDFLSENYYVYDSTYKKLRMEIVKR